MLRGRFRQNGIKALPGIASQKSSESLTGVCDVTIIDGGGCFSSKRIEARAKKTYL